MKISTLISTLQEVQTHSGDINCIIEVNEIAPLLPIVAVMGVAPKNSPEDATCILYTALDRNKAIKQIKERGQKDKAISREA